MTERAEFLIQLKDLIHLIDEKGFDKETISSILLAIIDGFKDSFDSEITNVLLEVNKYLLNNEKDRAKEILKNTIRTVESIEDTKNKLVQPLKHVSEGIKEGEVSKEEKTEKKMEEEKEDEGIDSELLEIFMEEVREHLNELDSIIVDIENNLQKEDLHSLMRIAHTIKGSAAMLGFMELSSVAHLLEDIFEAMEKGELQLSKEDFNTVFTGIDLIRGMIDRIKRDGLDTGIVKQEIIGALERIKEHIKTTEMDIGQLEEEPSVESVREKDIRIPLDRLDSLLNLSSELNINKSLLLNKFGKLFNLGNDVERLLKQIMEIYRGFEILKGELTLYKSSLSPAELATFSRYDNLERRLNNVIIGLKDYTASFENKLHVVEEETNRYSLLVNKLQEEVLHIRMVPVIQLFGRFKRVIRDMADRLGKKVNIIIKGEETLIDKRIINKMIDPFLHLLKNAVEHGIETKENRIEKGKPAIGNITLLAYSTINRVVLEINDDGRGLDYDVIKDKAVEEGLLAPESRVSHDELIQFLFNPGFTTMDKAGFYSGRGVGLDIVKNTVEELNGSIDVESKTNEGIRIILSFPITIGISEAVYVKEGNQIFLFPISSIVRVEEFSEDKISKIAGLHYFRLRDVLIPFVGLSDILKIDSSQKNGKRGFIIVVRYPEGKVGIKVDNILEREQILIKYLPLPVSRIKYFSGATISGTGRVVLILNPVRLVSLEKIKEIQVKKEVSPYDEENIKELDEPSQKGDILVVDDSPSVRRFISRMLLKEKYSVETASDGREALQKIKNKKYNLVITDLEMPVMNGIELIKAVRNISWARNIHIVVISARSGLQHKTEVYGYGAEDFLTKPYTRDDLMSIVRRYATV